MANDNLRTTIQVPVSKVVHSRSYSEQSQRAYDYETLESLTNSIKETGVWQPLIVTAPSENGFYMVIDGDHRLEAARKAGLDSIPVTVIETLSADDEIEADVNNYVLNKLRSNLTFAESARIYGKLVQSSSHDLIAKYKARMGLSERNEKRYDYYNRLDDRSKASLEKAGLASNDRVISAVLGITDPDARAEYLERALAFGKECPNVDSIPEFLANAKKITENLSQEVQSHFNNRELLLSYTEVVDLINFFDTEEEQMDMINRLSSIDNGHHREVAAQYLRLLKGNSAADACPEMAKLVLEPEFPADVETLGKTVDAIITFRSVYPDDPEKRFSVMHSLLSQYKLDESSIVRITNNIEKSLEHYPDEIQTLFFDGNLPFSDYVFSAIDGLLEKKWDLNTSLDLIERSSAGKFLPEHFATRLNKLVREKSDFFDSIAQTSNQPKGAVKNSSDVIKSLGYSDEERAEWNELFGDKKENDNELLSDVETDQEDEEFEDASDTGKTDIDIEDPESSAEENSLQQPADDSLSVIFDSMRRVLDSTVDRERSIYEKCKDKSLTIKEIFMISNEFCINCRKAKFFDVNVVPFCKDCGVPGILEQLENKE